jgi:hypothetical protein
MPAGGVANASVWHAVAPVVGRHALRLILLAVVIGPLLRWRSRARRCRAGDRRPFTDGEAAVATSRAVVVRYAVAGLVLGATWVWHENQPPWEHALRVLVVLLVVGPGLRWLRERVVPRWGRGGARRFPWRGWIAAKLTVVLLGVAAEWLLERWVSRTVAATVVAVAVALAVALGGPWLHGRRARSARGAFGPAGSAAEVADQDLAGRLG